MKTEQREAGPALNAEVAVKVFGRTHYAGANVPKSYAHSRDDDDPVHEVWVDGSGCWCNLCGDLPDFSGTIAAAFLVVEAMRAKGWFVTIGNDRKGWAVAFDYGTYCEGDAESEAEALPLAICLAALRALDRSPSSSAVATPSSSVSREDTR